MQPTESDTPPDTQGGASDDTMSLDAVRRPAVDAALIDGLRRELDAVKRRVLRVSRAFERLPTKAVQ